MMIRKALAGTGAGVVVAVGIGACGAGGSTGATTTTRPGPGTSSTSATGSIPATSKGGSSPSASASTPAGAVNLAVSVMDRAALLIAGAKLANLPASDFTGLRPGQTYLARDTHTGSYWAAAGLLPSKTSLPAQISVQDDGAYLIFVRPVGGSWKATDAGVPGSPKTCAATGLPADVVSVWGWAPGTCRPRSGL